MSYKYPEDFRDWKPLGAPCPTMVGRYIVLESPDGRLQALIHLDDNDVVGVRDIAGRDIYSHPVTLEGARRVLWFLWTNIQN